MCPEPYFPVIGQHLTEVTTGPLPVLAYNAMGRTALMKGKTRMGFSPPPLLIFSTKTCCAALDKETSSGVYSAEIGDQHQVRAAAGCLFACVVELLESSFSSGSHTGVERSAPDSTTAAITPAYHQSMGEAPDNEPDESPRRSARRRIVVLAVVGSLVVVGLAACASWQLRDDPPTLTEQAPPTLTEQDPPTLTEQVAAVPGISEELAASMVDEAQSTSAVIDRIVDQCAKGTSARAFGARVATGTPPELRAAVTAAWEIIYKYYCPEAASS